MHACTHIMLLDLECLLLVACCTWNASYRCNSSLYPLNRLLQAYFTDGLTPDRALMDKVAANLNFDMTAYNNYMNSTDNFAKAEREAMEWRSKVNSGRVIFKASLKTRILGTGELKMILQNLAVSENHLSIDRMY